MGVIPECFSSSFSHIDILTFLHTLNISLLCPMLFIHTMTDLIKDLISHCYYYSCILLGFLASFLTYIFLSSFSMWLSENFPKHKYDSITFLIKITQCPFCEAYKYLQYVLSSALHSINTKLP